MAAARLGDLTSERAERIVQRVAQRERFAPTEQTRAAWARQRRRTPDLRSAELREGLAALDAGCIGKGVQTLRDLAQTAPKKKKAVVGRALRRAEATLQALGTHATVGEVSKFEWQRKTKERLARLTGTASDIRGMVPDWLRDEDVVGWDRPSSVASERAPPHHLEPLLAPQLAADEKMEEGDDDAPSPVFSEAASPSGSPPPDEPSPAAVREQLSVSKSGGRRCRSAEPQAYPSVRRPQSMSAVRRTSRFGRLGGPGRTHSEPVPASAAMADVAKNPAAEDALSEKAAQRRSRRKAATPVTSERRDSSRTVPREGRRGVTRRAVRDAPALRAAAALAASLEAGKET